ncbi:TPA: succinylglutamate desuccinylase/aspartoacylase family protein [Yersinia enterocolitica]|uniref:succinylglutamate desuccinylase/aspartoacylase family protein n=1 Tax=Yersinia enterocolitica TaxID=630 RepID=UPI00094BB3F2|nr:succinylglutamate desuccinylase/aspartoacylase family protein [Yersinia enterocolitica]HEN3608147.1 succinylglutamate desuccinylase/aspartoacylase family protein [Yersinia enterocolitica]HEN3626499.1 succinylglutamate desuccinylase/aspartoacylase family protein [Yersinia enterocolitica]HEN3640464.1 succinylglutamate desuccinylase/aspartoacylase family protein [Yersinia enterocolitica]
MKINNHKLPEHALSGQRQLTSFHFGQPGVGEKIYLQAGLHADELPGMLVLHYLKRLLSQAERRGEIQSEIIIVPIANPPGMAQVLLNSGIGRFDLVSGRNFNRDFPDLAKLVSQPPGAAASSEKETTPQQIRRAMVDALQDLPALSEVDALRQHLLMLACDADLVLDLHCDDRAILHLYADPAWRTSVDVLAQFLHIDTVLLSQDSGGGSFDEACGLPWHRLAAHYPNLAPACMAVTVELRGQQDVSHPQASADAEHIYQYLQYRGAIAGVVPEIPQREVVMLPFSAGEIVKAPASGLLLLLRQPGEWVTKDDVVAEIIDPITDTVKAVRAKAGGIIYACRRAPFVTLGAEVMKIAGKTPYAGGGGLAS